MKTFTTTLTLMSLFLSTVYGQAGESWYGTCKVSTNDCYYQKVLHGKLVNAESGCAWVRPLPKKNNIETCKETKANLFFFSLIGPV